MPPPTRTHLVLSAASAPYAFLCHYTYSHIAANANTLYVVLVSVLSFLYLVEVIIAVLALIVTLSLRALINAVIVAVYSLHSLSVLKQATTLSPIGALLSLLFSAGFAASLYGVIDSGRMLFTATRRRREPIYIRTT